MGARDLLHTLTALGLSVRIEAGQLRIGPASRMTPELASAVRSAKPELLALLKTSGDAPAPVPPPASAPAATSAPAPACPCRLTAEQADAAHREPWTAQQIECFTGRAHLLWRRGLLQRDAEDLAELAHLRDVTADDRRMCLECRHLSGSAGAWQCRASHPDALRGPVATVVATALQRCAGFAPEPLAYGASHGTKRGDQG